MKTNIDNIAHFDMTALGKAAHHHRNTKAKQNNDDERFWKHHKHATPDKGGAKRLIFALKNSYNGLTCGWKTQAAIRQEIAIMLIAIPIATLIANSPLHYMILIGVLLLVLALELLNTAIELLCDYIQPEFDARIGVIKDLGSAGVFVCLVLSVMVWTHAIYAHWF